MSGPSSLLPSFLFLFTYNILYSISRKKCTIICWMVIMVATTKHLEQNISYTVVSIAKATFSIRTIMLY